MKQLLSLFLFLLPCLALAQYPSNGNQKITLGEQTTADGLIYRGVASDTTLTVKSDTAAYFVLDTVNINLYTYKASATGRKWRQLGADTASIAYVNTYGTQTVNGAKTFTSALTATRFNPTGSTVTGTGIYLPATNTLGFSTAGTNRMSMTDTGNIILPLFELNNTNAIQIGQNVNSKMHIGTGFGASFIQNNNFYNGSQYVFDDASVGSANMVFSTAVSFQTGAAGVNPTTKMTVANNGNIGINELEPTEKLHVVGNARISGLAGTGSRAVLADANGVLSAPVSSINKKENVQILNYGLNELLQINPVSFDYINKIKWGDERNLGFIVEDMFPVIPEVTGTMDNGDMYLDMVKLIPVLTKAIQEQQAQINALKQRLLILENK